MNIYMYFGAALGLIIGDTVLSIILLISREWVRYCDVACRGSGLLEVDSFCVSEQRCVDALQYGVFAMLCASMACRAYFLYTLSKAVYYAYHHQVLGEHAMDGLLLSVQIVFVIVAQYTFSLVVFLKLNGDQNSSFSQVGWPFYATWGGLGATCIAFYIQRKAPHVVLDIEHYKINTPSKSAKVSTKHITGYSKK